MSQWYADRASMTSLGRLKKGLTVYHCRGTTSVPHRHPSQPEGAIMAALILIAVLGLLAVLLDLWLNRDLAE